MRQSTENAANTGSTTTGEDTAPALSKPAASSARSTGSQRRVLQCRRRPTRCRVLVTMAQIVILAVVLDAWQLTAEFGIGNVRFTTEPTEIGASPWNGLAKGAVLGALGTTLYESLLGFAISVLHGILAGVALHAVLGYVKQNGIRAEIATLTTGLSATAALNAGSLDVTFADPAATGPLLAKETKLRLILHEQTIHWRILVPAEFAGQPCADVVKQSKVVGAPSASGGTVSLIKLIENASGIRLGTIKVVADRSGTGMAPGSEQGIIVKPAFSCVLENHGLDEALSFVKPLESSYPSELHQAVGIPDIGYWTLDGYAHDNPKVIAGPQAALTKAETWANNPNNLTKWVKIMRASPLNNKSLNDEQYTNCLSSVLGSLEPHFSRENAATWSRLTQIERILPVCLPDSARWLDKNVPAS